MDGLLSDPYQILESEEASYEEIFVYLILISSTRSSSLDAGSSGTNEGQPLTFGSLNRAAKLGPQTILRFPKLLNAHPDSRFILASPGLDNPLIQQDICGRFAARRWF